MACCEPSPSRHKFSFGGFVGVKSGFCSVALVILNVIMVIERDGMAL